jgi:V/A-type H+-transporting ATPase subunit F
MSQDEGQAQSRDPDRGQGQEIAVVGSPEFTTGFRLAGVRRSENVPPEQKAEDLDDAVEAVLGDDGVGIVVMHESDLEYLSRPVREDVETSVEPVVVTLGGSGASGLREQIRSAIGIDLMDDEDEDESEPTTNE